MPKKSRTETPENFAERALNEVRKIMAQAGAFGEREVYESFTEAFGGEIAGWEMRLRELKAEEE